jgi:hypothetical protein
MRLDSICAILAAWRNDARSALATRSRWPSMHTLSIYFMHYNFVRIHQTLRCSPAMEAGVTDRLRSLEDMVGIVDEWETAKKSQGKEP